MNIRKLVSLCLIANLVSLVSCQNENVGGEVTTAPSESSDETTAEIDYLETLPKEDYGGYEFRIIAQSYDQRPNLPLYEEENGEILNDAIIKRNRKTEETLGVTIVNYPYENRDEVKDKVKSTVMADEDAYDLVITSVNFGLSSLTLDGCLYDLSALPYLDLSNGWWCRSLVEDFAVGGHLYFTSGSLSPFFYYMPSAIAYNKTLTDEYKITGLYELVRSGEWTFDKLKELTADKAVDVNGDSKYDENDKYAIVGAPADGYMLGGFGERMIVRENDDFKLNMGSESFISKIEELNAYFNDESVFYGDNDTEVFYKMFVSDRAMFMQTSMNNLITGYKSVPSAREMESDYGILPLPKYDKAQESYYSVGQPAGPSGIAVPATCRDASRTSLVMEVMGYYSYDLIRDAAYDNVVKGKTARIDGTDEMLDIVYSNVFFDLNNVFDFGTTNAYIQKYLGGESEGYISGYESRRESAQLKLDEYVENLKSLG